MVAAHSQSIQHENVVFLVTEFQETKKSNSKKLSYVNLNQSKQHSP